MSATPFGLGRTWLAIRSNDREALRVALGFDRMQESSFSEGLSAVGRERAFVTPAFDDWTLVVVERSDVSELATLAQRISKTLGEVQVFVCRGRGRHYAWLSAKAGALDRAFEVRRGTIRRNQGEPRRGEPDAGRPIDESSVLEVAGSWSVDPSTLALKTGSGAALVGHWPATSGGPSLSAMVPSLIGGLGIVLIEIAAVIALGRVFAHVADWWLGAALGLMLAAYAWLAPKNAKLRRPALLIGIAVTMGAVLGGAFPANHP